MYIYVYIYIYIYISSLSCCLMLSLWVGWGEYSMSLNSFDESKFPNKYYSGCNTDSRGMTNKQTVVYCVWDGNIFVCDINCKSV